MVTDKQTYLRKLKKLLQWHLPCEDAKEALEDVATLFDDGLAAGETEAQLCQDFGDPAQMAKGLVAEQPMYGSQLQIKRVILWILAGAVILFLARLFVDFSWAYFFRRNWLILLPCVGEAAGILAWLLCGGYLLRSTVFARPNHRREYLCWQIILPAFTLLSYQFLLARTRYYLDNEISSSGPILANISYAIIFLHLLLAAYAVWRLLRGNIYMPAIVMQAVGNVGVAQNLLSALFSMDLENTGGLSWSDYVISFLPNPLLCVGLSLFCAAVFLFWLHMVGRDGI